MMSDVFPKTAPGALVFRQGAARFFGWVWLVFAAANFVDLIWRGRDVASLVAAAALLMGCGIAYAVGLRPRIVADEDAVHLYNLVRDVHLPWHAVEKIEGGDAVCVHADGRRFRAYVLQTSPRNRARAELKARHEQRKLPDPVAEYVRGRTPTDFAVEQLRELADRRRTADVHPQAAETDKAGKERPASAGAPVVRWALPVIIALAAPAAFLVVALVIATA
jgi:hypothetical protein